LAIARGLNARHAFKQVDRMLSNPGIDVDQILAFWVPFVIGARTLLLVAMDWTDFDTDHQASIMLSLITEHGRATPLVWLTVNKADLKHRRSLYERRVLVRLTEIVPAGVGVCIIADRGFGDQKLYQPLAEELHFEYVIRFRGNIKVTAASGVTHTAAAWVSLRGCSPRAGRRAASAPFQDFALDTTVLTEVTSASISLSVRTNSKVPVMQLGYIKV
jgi:hypothetical protein